MRWIDDMECRVSDLREPFSDTCNVTKSEQKGYVETLILGPNQVPGKFVAGHQLLRFRENLWLHTTSILVSLMVLRDEYPNVGIVSPSFHDFVKTEQRKRTAGGFGCANPQNKRVIGIFSVRLHWVAVLVDRTIRTETNKGVCFMFDPLQLERNYAMIEKCVWSTIEGLLQLEDMLTYEKVVAVPTHALFVQSDSFYWEAGNCIWYFWYFYSYHCTPKLHKAASVLTRIR
ncbi:hypothetical protein PC128_g21760 [Phytophthora cactorum]|nr:hypothetical protein PC128_g21760 [Phytophthora cactorum]